MSTRSKYHDSNDLYASSDERSGFVTFALVLLGIAAGAAGGMFFAQRDFHRELASLKSELAESRHDIQVLTGYADDAAKTNSLLGQLRRQRTSLAENQLLAGELEHTLAKVEAAASRIDDANAVLARMEELQQQIVNQQCLASELAAALDQQKMVQYQLIDLASAHDSAKRSLDALAHNQAKMQHIAGSLEENELTVDRVASVLDKQLQLSDDIASAQSALDLAAEVAADSAELHGVLADNRRNSEQALSSLDEMVWICEYLNAQSPRLAITQANLRQIDEIQKEAATLSDSIGGLVENVETIRGLNRSLSSIVTTTVGMRSGLAEIMLLEPAVRQLVTNHRELEQLVNQTQQLDVQTRAKQLIAEYEEVKEPVYVSQKP
ncbi:hypothetical protein LOC68_04245 [Blastopirellula sp. JC732]|uniref:Uncharacterized protein n=1 Tax=Blastopirellula sediminis TaxID=2894196 RepID=A0A9X1MI29_9BACT|nr:hypothetical protein [Blastopirellula sediminis]MCC9609631.1 hypothetical protein [Blastopirellula sediminis]MCC9627593.1 hypothetical protein [Blastopirellula sediminis]